MSFLFGKKSKQQNNALPAATRDISSSSGPPPANGTGGRVGPSSQTPTPGASVNNSLNSLQATGNAPGPVGGSGPGPEQKAMRERGETGEGGRPRGNPQDSPYPWSFRRLNFTTTVAPFPRYGAAINANASKDGLIYIMGGLVAGQAVKGDLWVAEMGNGNMACYPISTTGDGPGPRVGHASLLVGNAFIVFGGDTKLEENDDLDDTLYLLNTSTKHWSRALPQGPRPTGRYGHTLNILGSKIYIFGGQVEGFFFNDLVAFDLNSLQSSNSRWEVLLSNTNKDGAVSSPQARAPPARTNHSVVTWQDKLFLFGGTDGVNWFNDVWTYDPRTNSWTELDCIGYIPVAREGHSATLVNDTMYIFGGRTQEGVDLGDLAAFRISSRRWYMFQNMGHSPSPRSGHSMTAYGKHVIVLAGEPSSSIADKNELSLAYILDTSKIRYPPNEAPPPQQGQGMNAPRKMSGERSMIPNKTGSPPTRQSMLPGPEQTRPQDPLVNGSRLPRAAGQAPSGPPPLQQAPQPRAMGPNSGPGSRSRTPTKGERNYGPPVDTMRAASFDRENLSPSTKGSPSTAEGQTQSQKEKAMIGPRKASDATSQREPKGSMDTSRSGSLLSRNTSKSHRNQHSLESIEQETPKHSLDTQQRGASREAERLIDSGLGASPAVTQQNDELLKELETAKSRNAWYESELALARKAGYNPVSATSPIFPEQSVDAFGDEDRPLFEALLKMKSELERVQNSIKIQSGDAARRIGEVERQRDAAIGEAIYAKSKLAAHGGGSQAGTPQPDGARSTATPDMDRVADINRRLAASLAAQSELVTKVDKLTAEIEAERRAKQLADDTAEAAQRRVQELDSTRQKNAAEFEELRAALHETERVAREASASAAEAEASSKLLTVDKSELGAKLTKVTEESRNHTTILHSLREALSSSSDKATLLEKKLEEERYQKENLRQKMAQLRAEHEDQTTELEAATEKLRDAEELAEKYAEEARLHRQAVLSGLGQMADRGIEDDHTASDERVAILTQQVEASNIMVRKNQTAADAASEKLRRAEERIAGLEAYQEQSSREGLTIRKQLQQATRDMQASDAEKAEIHQQYERLRLESNAFEVQLKTLKNLLEERGVSAVDARRSRVLDSPSSRFGTPELNRVRELEQQIDSMNKAHEELRTAFETREHDVSKEWEEKLQALHNDHQAAVKYLRGTEKMLSKMKQELDRHKHEKAKLEEELAQSRQASRSPTKAQSSDWDVERASLQTELTTVQENMRSTVSQLESQLTSLQSELTSARQEAEAAARSARSAESSAEQSRGDLETLRRNNADLEQRAREAETRVQMFLDQFETSVDNYRRQSTVPGDAVNGAAHGHRRQQESIDSIYSDNDGSATPEGNAPNSAATRNSMALDNLASELDALRSHWETTNKAYRLSDRFDFERTPTSEKSELTESLSQWRQRMDMEDDVNDVNEIERKPVAPRALSPTSGPGPAPAPPATTTTTAPSGPGGTTMI